MSATFAAHASLSCSYLNVRLGTRPATCYRSFPRKLGVSPILNRLRTREINVHFITR